MRNLFQKLWRDDCGAVLSVEWTMLTGVGVLGCSAGAVAVRDAVNRQMQNISTSIDAMVPQPNLSGWKNQSASVPGVQVPQPQYQFSRPEATPVSQQVVIVLPPQYQLPVE